MDLNPSPEYNLDEEMKTDVLVISYIENRDIAVDFYRALCNMRWKKDINTTAEDKIIDKLRGIDSAVWSCTWRYAGGLIAAMRNEHYNTTEDYMDFYCSGEEGCVSPLVKECFERMGWIPHPWKE